MGILGKGAVFYHMGEKNIPENEKSGTKALDGREHGML